MGVRRATQLQFMKRQTSKHLLYANVAALGCSFKAVLLLTSAVQAPWMVTICMDCSETQLHLRFQPYQQCKKWNHLLLFLNSWHQALWYISRCSWHAQPTRHILQYINQPTRVKHHEFTEDSARTGSYGQGEFTLHWPRDRGPHGPDDGNLGWNRYQWGVWAYGAAIGPWPKAGNLHTGEPRPHSWGSYFRNRFPPHAEYCYVLLISSKYLVGFPVKILIVFVGFSCFHLDI